MLLTVTWLILKSVLDMYQIFGSKRIFISQEWSMRVWATAGDREAPTQLLSVECSWSAHANTDGRIWIIATRRKTRRSSKHGWISKSPGYGLDNRGTFWRAMRLNVDNRLDIATGWTWNYVKVIQKLWQVLSSWLASFKDQPLLFIIFLFIINLWHCETVVTKCYLCGLFNNPTNMNTNKSSCWKSQQRHSF